MEKINIKIIKISFEKGSLSVFKNDFPPKILSEISESFILESNSNKLVYSLVYVRGLVFIFSRNIKELLNNLIKSNLKGEMKNKPLDDFKNSTCTFSTNNEPFSISNEVFFSQNDYFDTEQAITPSNIIDNLPTVNDIIRNSKNKRTKFDKKTEMNYKKDNQNLFIKYKTIETSIPSFFEKNINFVTFGFRDSDMKLRNSTFDTNIIQSTDFADTFESYNVEEKIISLNFDNNSEIFNFSDLIKNDDKFENSKIFFEILIILSDRKISAIQKNPYGNINLTKKN